MLQYSKTPTFVDTDLSSPITEFALALAAGKGDVWRPSGTAVVIAPSLVITASHVISDYLESFDNVRLSEGSVEGSFELKAFQVLEGKKLAIWTVTRLWVSMGTDAAILRLTPCSEEAASYCWRMPIVNILPPPVGSRVAGFGYHSPKMGVASGSDDFASVELQVTPATTIGEVREIFEAKRDSTRLPFPCFQVNAKTRGGMSGGPLFNENGHLCGLICSTFPDPLDGLEAISYATTLWPVMGLEIDMDGEGWPEGKPYPVLELARLGIVRALGWEHVELAQEDGCSPRKVVLRT